MVHEEKNRENLMKMGLTLKLNEDFAKTRVHLRGVLNEQTVCKNLQCSGESRFTWFLLPAFANILLGLLSNYFDVNISRING